MAAFTPDTSSGKGFFGSLFDFSFRHFVALKFIKVIYAILVTLIGLGTLLFMATFISQGGAYIALGIIVVPLGALVYLIFARISLEVMAVLFRIGENTSALVSAGSLSLNPPSQPVATMPQAPQPPAPVEPKPPTRAAAAKKAAAKRTRKTTQP